MPALGQRLPGSTWLKQGNPLKCYGCNAEHAELQLRKKVLYPNSLMNPSNDSYLLILL